MMRKPPSSGIRSFLVVISGSEPSTNALSMTCEIARRTHAAVAALHVIEVPRALPIDAELSREVERGEQILDAAERLAKQMDVQLDGRIVQARDAGAAIVDEAEALHSDAIVLGVAYHRPYGRFEVGELALHVLENARAQVWLIRYPPEADQLG